MHNKVVITADRACDLNEELIKKFNIQLIPFYININEKSYVADEEITSAEIFEIFNTTGKLPKTAVMGVGEYIRFFKQWIDKGYDVVHISIGSNLSGAHQNALAAKNEIGDNLYLIDSQNISTGMGLLVLEAAQRAQNGMSAEPLAYEVQALIKNIKASFLLEDLKFLKAGGRCSALAVLGANILLLKPSIEVKNGIMDVNKKYRGKWEKVVLQYSNAIIDSHSEFINKRAFITHSGVSQKILDSVYKIVESKNIFDEIFITQTESTTASHAGPNVIGIAFMSK